METDQNGVMCDEDYVSNAEFDAKYKTKGMKVADLNKMQIIKMYQEVRAEFVILLQDIEFAENRMYDDEDYSFRKVFQSSYLKKVETLKKLHKILVSK